MSGSYPTTNASDVLSTRVPTAADQAEVERREAISAAAARYLIRTENSDLLPILGLQDPGIESRRCANPACGKPMVSPRARTRYCSPGCSATDTNRQRRAKRATAT